SELPLSTGFELIERALTLVPSDSHEAGRLQARRIMPLRPDYDRAQEAFHHALSIARQQQDKALEMQALVAAACVDYHHCRHVQSLERNQQAIDLAQLVDLPIEEAHARYDLEHVLYAMGNLEEATRHAEAMLAAAERAHTRVWHCRSMDANENVCSAKGDWRSARDFSEQGLATSPQDPGLLGPRALLEHQLGETDAAEAYLERLLETLPGGESNLPDALTSATIPYYVVSAVVISVVAYITGEMTHFDVVEGIAQFIFSSPITAPAHSNAARIGLAFIAVQRQDMIAASELYDALQPIGGTMAPQSNCGPGLAGDRVLGLLSQTMGRLDQATVHFEDALTFCRKAGYRPELAWICCDYADTLLQRGNPGDQERAMSLLEESLASSTELGMRPLMERVLSRREILRA
ncbi:MAG: tetratricopeptide repeat protein, partial [Dehalococcoidia bacterium]